MQCLFVADLITKLFGIIPSIHPHPTDLVTNIEISRTALVTYLEEIGLHRGHKVRQQVDIPEWIKGRPEFSKACVRGLMDTDGSIFREKHTIKGKEYAYPRLWFVSYSRPLRESVYQILAEAGFCPKVRSERAVTLEKRDDICRYFATIGTHNAKHQNRFANYMEGCSEW